MTNLPAAAEAVAAPRTLWPRTARSAGSGQDATSRPHPCHYRLLIAVLLTLLCLEWLAHVPSRLLTLYLQIGSSMECGYDGINSFECRNCDCRAFPRFMFLPSKCIMPDEDVAQNPTSPQTLTHHLVSIVVVCHNQERYLIGAMNSVWAATSRLPAKAHESFLVDDASSCLSPRVRARARQLGFHAHRNEHNMWLARTRNYAAAHLARGDYIIFLDADDRLHPQWLAEAWPHLGTVDFIYGNQILFNMGARAEWNTDPNVTVADVAARGPFPITNVIRRNAYLAYGGFPASMIYGNEDYAFWTTLVRSNISRVHVDAISSYYRMKQVSMAREPAYKRFGKSMQILSHPAIFSNERVCRAMRIMSSGRHREGSLERALRSTDRDCPGWIFLALHKQHVRCTAEMSNFWNEALEACERGIKERHASNDTLLLLSYLKHAKADHSQCKRDLYSYPAWTRSPPAAPYRWYTEQSPPEAIACPVAPVALASLARTVPKIIHFIYALKPGAPFGVMHRMAIVSAKHVYPDYRILFHCSYIPEGQHWEAVQDWVSVVFIDPKSNVYAGRCLQHHAHEADYLRLRALHDHGGIYFDIDTITLRPLPQEHLRDGRFIIAKQDTWCYRRQKRVLCTGKFGYGLCNAVMASPPGNAFVADWLRRYDSFASNGMDGMWDYHSVRLPAQLAECSSLSAHVHILDPSAFFPFYWGEAQRVLFSPARNVSAFDFLGLFGRPSAPSPNVDLSKSYTIHLWTSGNDKNYARKFAALSLDEMCHGDGQSPANLYSALVCALQNEV